MLPLLNWLVRFLSSLIPEETLEIEQPKYLVSISREVPDVAVQAVRKESVRLYDLAVEVINSGLSIRQEVFDSESKAKRIVRKSKRVIDEDLDTLYERKLKSLYAAIVEFIVQYRQYSRPSGS